MVKTYLRYRQDAVLGVVASAGASIDISAAPDAAGNFHLFTPQLERVGVWSLATGVQLKALEAAKSSSGAVAADASVTCTRAAPVAAAVAVGYDDGAVRTFDCARFIPSAVFHGHKKAILSLSYSADGSLLASGSRDTTIVVWDLLSETGLCRFRGHKDEVTSVAFITPGGGAGGAAAGSSLLVSGSKDTLVKVWDLRSRCCVQTLVGARSEVWSLAVAPQQDRVLAGTADQQLHVWRVGATAGAAAGADEAALAPAPAAASGASPHGSSDAAPLTPMGTLTRQTHERASLVRFSADGALAAVQCAGKTIEVLRRRTPEEAARRLQRRLRRHREKLGKKKGHTAADSADDGGGGGDDDTLLAGTSLADVDALLEQLNRGLEGSGQAEALAPALEGGGGPGPAAWVVASDEWELAGIVQAAQRISAFAFVPPLFHRVPGAPPVHLAVALHSNVVEVHALRPLLLSRGDSAPPAPGDPGTVTTAAGITVAQSSVLRTIGGQPGHRSDVRAVAVNADGSLLLSVAGAQARVWNAKTGVCIRTLELGSTDTVGLCAAFAPGSRHAFVGTKTGRLLLFDLATADLLEAHDAHTLALWAIDVRPDGRGCATGGADKEVRFWDFDLREVKTGGAEEEGAGGGKGGSKKKGSAPAAPGAAPAAVKQLTLVHARTLKLTDEVLAVRYSHHADPAQLLVAAALLDSTVRIFFDDTLKFFLSLYGHKLPVLAMDISADSTLLVTASADKNVKVWGLDFGDCHKSFLAHGDSVTSVAFLSRTHYFFSAGKDRTLKYWDADRFEHILTLEGHKGEVWGVAAAPDGAFVVTGSHDRSVRVWARTEEQVFVEEEREREFDSLLERQLREADDSAEAALGGDDAVGPVDASGFAVPTGMDALVPTAQPVGGAGKGGDAATTLVARASHDSMQGADRLLQALGLAAEETKRWSDYVDDLAAAEAAGEADPAAAVDTPPRNPLLLGLTPSGYLLRVLRSVRPADLDQVLLVLPFTSALALLQHVRHWLEGGQATELLARCALLLLRVHHRALVANQALRPLLDGLKSSLQARVAELRDCVGVNVAALRYLSTALASESGAGSQLPGPQPPATAASKPGPETAGVRIGKRRRVQLF